MLTIGKEKDAFGEDVEINPGKGNDEVVYQFDLQSLFFPQLLVPHPPE